VISDQMWTRDEARGILLGPMSGI